MDMNIVKSAKELVSLTDAEIICSGGRGLGDAPGFKLIQKFADKVGGTNKDKLVRAITFIENEVLKKVPFAFRGIIDFAINPRKIADLIERRITATKLKKI